jgi:hypothetical protein
MPIKPRRPATNYYLREAYSRDVAHRNCLATIRETLAMAHQRLLRAIAQLEQGRLL